MPDRNALRRENLGRCFDSEGVEGLLVASVPNVRYLGGFTGDSSILLVLRDRTLIVSDGRYAEQIGAECPDLEVVIRPVGQLLIPAAAEVASKLGIAQLGFEAAHLTVAEHLELRSKLLPSVELKPVLGRVEELRAVKDDEEQAAIREAIRIAERAFAMVRSGLRSEDSEKDVADSLEAYLRRCGATAASFPPIVAVGPGAARPHYQPSPAVRVGDADFVLIDWGATGTPYKSDLTRVLVTGKVTSKFEEVYQSVLRAQERAIAAIRPGVQAEAVDAQSRAAIADAGFGRYFEHGLGHGIGLEIHEAPWFRKGSETVLRPGMVVTVEPGIYLPGWGGVRIEDDVLVTPDGCEVLSRVPRSLDEVRCG